MDVLLFILLVLFLSGMDIWYTYYNLRLLRRHEKRWRSREFNVLVQWCWSRFGFRRGSLIAALVTIAGVVAAGLLIGDDVFFQGFVVGVFFIIHHIHYLNYAYIQQRYLGRASRFWGFITDW